jgi:hypothetical protein
MSLMDFSEEGFNIQQRTLKEEREILISLHFLMKKKIKLLSYKEKLLTYKKDSEERVPEKLSLKTKSLNSMLKHYH